jgi:hypothetical protein
MFFARSLRTLSSLAIGESSSVLLLLHHSNMIKPLFGTCKWDTGLLNYVLIASRYQDVYVITSLVKI